MPELGPYGSVRGRFQFGLRSMPPATTTAVPLQGDHLSRQRDARGVSQTPGLSGSAVALLDQVAPVLHSHDSVPFFAGSMISSPAAPRRRASCLTDSAERRRVRCSCDAPCAVLFPGSSITTLVGAGHHRCELDQVSGGGQADGKEMLFCLGLVGVALISPQGR